MAARQQFCTFFLDGLRFGVDVQSMEGSGAAGGLAGGLAALGATLVSGFELVADRIDLAAVPERGPTGDVLVSHKVVRFQELPTGATVATSSLRRRAQVLHRRPDLKLVDIRGNVETRLRKLEAGVADATILAMAGLKRLGLADKATAPIPNSLSFCTPSPMTLLT